MARTLHDQLDYQRAVDEYVRRGGRVTHCQFGDRAYPQVDSWWAFQKARAQRAKRGESREMVWARVSSEDVE